METVFHLSSGDEDDWVHGLANVENFRADETVDADATLVVNGDAVHVVRRGSPFASRVSDLVEDGATVCACSNSLAGRDVPADDLLAGVLTVSSAMGELTRRQADGAAYVKVP